MFGKFSYCEQPGKKSYNIPAQPGKPLVSIVSGFYNSSEYFEQTWQCVMNQTFPWFEWIIVNDGSTPEQSEFLENFAKKDSRIRVIVQENKGLSAARNAAIEAATTEIIFTLDTDDLMEPTYLEYAYLSLLFHPEAGWSCTDCVGFQGQEYLYKKVFCSDTEVKENTLGVLAGIRKSMWKDVGGYLEMPFSFNEDWHLWLKCLAKGYRPVHIHEYQYWYRRLDTGMLSNIRKNEEISRKNKELLSEAAKDIHDSIVEIVPFDTKKDDMPCSDIGVSAQDGKGINILFVPSITGTVMDILQDLSKQGKYALVLSLGVDHEGVLQKARRFTPYLYCVKNFLPQGAEIWMLEYLLNTHSAERILCYPCQQIQKLYPLLKERFGEKVLVMDAQGKGCTEPRKRELKLKYGLMVYENTDNIGDDIQSYAARCFLPRIDYIIDREALNKPEIPEDEAAAVIMNGWYMANKFNWPPSQQIEPLPVAMHFTHKDPLMIGRIFYSGISGDTMRGWGPVGVRDSSTLQEMKNWKIDCYFSGCMTLTLNRIPCEPATTKYICAVDLPEDLQAALRQKAEQAGIELKVVTHDVNPQENSKLGWEARQKAVEERLKLYQNAVCVVTPRLHCALPCLALEVPVLLIYQHQSNDSDRLEDYSKLVHYTNSKDYLEGNCEYDVTNPPANSKEYLKIRNSLIEKCREFIHQVEENPTVIRWEWDDIKDRYAWQNRMMEETLDNGRDRIYQRYDIPNLLQAQKWNQTAIEQLTEGKNWLEGQWKSLQQQNEELSHNLSQLQQGKDWLEEQWNLLKEQVSEKEKNIIALQEKNRQLQAQLSQTKADLEWAKTPLPQKVVTKVKSNFPK